MAYKPGSVPLAEGRPSISTVDRSTAPAVNPEIPAVRWSPPHAAEASPYSTLLQAEFAAFHPAAGRSPRRTRLCGTGPRLTADGRYPLPCTLEPGLSSTTPEGADATVRPSRREGSLARRNRYDEPVERREDVGGESAGELLVIQVVIEVGEHGAGWGKRRDELERLLYRLMGRVRQVAQRRDNQEVEPEEARSRRGGHRGNIGQIGKSPAAPAVCFAPAVHDRDRLERSSCDVNRGIGNRDAECRDAMPWGGATVHRVLPTLAQLRRGPRTGAEEKHLILRVGVCAQLVDSTRMVDVDVGDEGAIETLDAKA